MKQFLIDSATGRASWKRVQSGLAGKVDSESCVLGNDRVKVHVDSRVQSPLIWVGNQGRISVVK